jgi:flagellar export protein FliJ
MMKSKRFEPIQEIASTSAKDLSRAMAEAGRKVADLERQLEQLQSYRDEYVRNSTQAAGTIDAVKLQNYRSFLDRLGEALRQHAKSLETARRFSNSARGMERKARRSRIPEPRRGSLSQGGTARRGPARAARG